MEFVKSSPNGAAQRLTAGGSAALAVRRGWKILDDENNVDGGEAFFRLESSKRAEDIIEALSSRVELERV